MNLKFFYWNHKNGDTLIFECEAEGILDADKLFETATGIKADKTPHIGCEIKEI